MSSPTVFVSSLRSAPRLAALMVCVACASCAATKSQAPAMTAPTPHDWFVDPNEPQTVGLYAASTPMYSAQHLVERDRQACVESGREFRVQGDADRLPDADHFWLYRTGKHIVLFAERWQVRLPKGECTAQVTRRRTVEVTQSRRGWPEPFSPDAELSRGPGIRRVDHEVFRGEQVKCVTMGYLVGHTQCVSEQRDLSRGILVRREFWSDDFSYDSSYTTHVLPHAQFPSRLLTDYASWGQVISSQQDE